PTAVPDALVARYLAPGRAVIVGSIQPALTFLGAVDQSIDAVRPGGARRQPDARRLRRKAMARQLVPRPAAIGRLVEAAARTVRWRISVPRRTPRSALGPYGCPSAAISTTSGLRGSTRICPICCVSESPIGLQFLPASAERNMPMPCEISDRMSASPVPT